MFCKMDRPRYMEEAIKRVQDRARANEVRGFDGEFGGSESVGSIAGNGKIFGYEASKIIDRFPEVTAITYGNHEEVYIFEADKESNQARISHVRVETGCEASRTLVYSLSEHIDNLDMGSGLGGARV